MTAIDTDGWEIRPFIEPAKSQSEAHTAAKRYLEWELQSLSMQAVKRMKHKPYVAAGECGYHIQGQRIYIRKPPANAEDKAGEWSFKLDDLEKPQQFELPL